MLKIEKLTLAAACSLLAFGSSAADLYVPSQYSTIQSAITAAQPGDQINVGPGTYQENIVIDKSLSLLGDGAQISTTSANPAVTIAADDVWISGMAITTTGAYGILANSQGGVTIDFCQFYYCGVELDFSKGATVQSCNFYSPAIAGVRSMGNGYLGGYGDLISNCQIYAGPLCGIYITDAMQPVTARWNTVWDCPYGIAVGDCPTNVTVLQNYVYSSDSAWYPFYLYAEFSDCNVNLEGNNLKGVHQDMPWVQTTALRLLNEVSSTLSVTGHFNRFASAYAVSTFGTGTIVTDLANNWWGQSSAPASDVSVAPWLVMSVSPLTATVPLGSPVNINVNWFTNSDGVDVSAWGAIPDGEDGYVWCDNGYFFDPMYGGYIPLTIAYGYSAFDYYPEGQGTATINFDNEVVPVVCNQ